MSLVSRGAGGDFGVEPVKPQVGVGGAIGSMGDGLPNELMGRGGRYTDILTEVQQQ